MTSNSRNRRSDLQRPRFTTATDFRKSIDSFLDEAARGGIVVITRFKVPKLALISSELFLALTQSAPPACDDEE